MLFSGWAAIYDLAAKSKNVPRADSIVDLIAAYLGVRPLLPIFTNPSSPQLPSSPASLHPSDCTFLQLPLTQMRPYPQPFLFLTLLTTYKLLYGTRIRSIDDMRNAWFVRDASEKEEEENGTAHTTARARKAAPRNRFYEFLSWVR